MPIQQARYATATTPPEKKKPTTVTMRTSATSQPYVRASPAHTPAMARPWMGRYSGREGAGGMAETVAPQLEQKRAVYGWLAPHRLQKTAMIDPP